MVANYKTEPMRKATRKFTLKIYSDFSANYENTYLKAQNLQYSKRKYINSKGENLLVREL